MPKINEALEILNRVDKCFPGERTPVLIHQYACVLSNFPVERLLKIETRITRSFRRWPILDEWEDLNEKIAEEEKIKNSRKRCATFPKNSPPSEDSGEIAKCCIKIFHQRHLGAKRMAEMMLEAAEKSPGLGMKRQGQSLMNFAMRRESKKVLLGGKASRWRKVV